MIMSWAQIQRSHNLLESRIQSSVAADGTVQSASGGARSQNHQKSHSGGEEGARTSLVAPNVSTTTGCAAPRLRRLIPVVMWKTHNKRQVYVAFQTCAVIPSQCQNGSHALCRCRCHCRPYSRHRTWCCRKGELGKRTLSWLACVGWFSLWIPFHLSIVSNHDIGNASQCLGRYVEDHPAWNAVASLLHLGSNRLCIDNREKAPVGIYHHQKKLIAITATRPSAEDSLAAYIFGRADGKGDTVLGPVGQHQTGRRGLKVTQSFFSK